MIEKSATITDTRNRKYIFAAMVLNKFEAQSAKYD